MRIESVRVYRYNLPIRPLFLKGQTIKTRSGLVVRVEGEDGARGYGDVAPLPGFSVEHLDDVVEESVRVARSIAGCALPPELVPLTDCFERWLAPHNLSASLCCGLQAAVLGMAAASRSICLSRFLCDEADEAVQVNALLDGSTEDVLAQAKLRCSEGYRSAKLKVGRKTVGEEIDLVRQVRALLGNDVALRLDANRAWDYNSALRFGRAVAECGIEHIEEPLRDPSRLVEFAGRTGIPVALDETLMEYGINDFERWRGVKAVVLKPTLLGGFEFAMWLARRAWNLDMTPVISSSFESGIGLAALANLAAAMGQPLVAAGLDTRRWFKADLLDSWPKLECGRLILSQVNRAASQVRFERMEEVSHPS